MQTIYKLLFIPVFVFALASCGGKKEKETTLPPGIMSEETFTRVLTDFALAESASSMNVKNINLQKLDSIYAFDPLNDNGVTREQYDSAVHFYVRHPDLYKKIYENVLAELSEIQLKKDPAKKDTTLK